MFYTKQSKATQKRIHADYAELFRRANSVFLAKLSAGLNRAKGSLDVQTPTFVHGNFHIGLELSTEALANSADLEFSDWGPWYVDLIRLESSALVAATLEGFRNFSPGQCLDAYVAGLDAASKSQSLNWPTRESPKLLSTAKENLEFGDSLDSSDALLGPLKLYFTQNNLGTLEDVKVSGGSGRFVVFADDKRVWELREISDSPLKDLSYSGRSSGIPACDRYKTAAELFGRPIPACLVASGKSYALGIYVASEPISWGTMEALLERKSRICSNLAILHNKNWTPFDRRSLSLALRKNSTLGDRIHSVALEQSQILLEGYRMILDQKNGQN